VAFVGDNANSIQIQGARNTCIQVTAIENSTLIVAFKRGQHSARSLAAIAEATFMLRRGIVKPILILGLLTSDFTHIRLLFRQI